MNHCGVGRGKSGAQAADVKSDERGVAEEEAAGRSGPVGHPQDATLVLLPIARQPRRAQGRSCAREDKARGPARELL
ncbi:MAG: hypothetical protein LUO89_03060 [Methanothrix sp.]|nr:hypothetical protein [Methanothrix sp.]